MQLIEHLLYLVVMCYSFLMDFYSIYIHVPFCRQRCRYCDFFSSTDENEQIPPYFQAVNREITLTARSVGKKLPVHTIYFGGGTPSIIPAKILNETLETIRELFTVIDTCEISFEANPGTLNGKWLKDVKLAGINRLSIGMQSANIAELMMLGRIHSHEDTISAAQMANSVGIKNINLDLIYGLPRQTINHWQSSLEAAISLNPRHLSLYALTLEPGTEMTEMVQNGRLPKPDNDLAADMLDIAEGLLASAGFHRYEISNWAFIKEEDKDYRCLHNMQYWRNKAYLGFGAGAHSSVDSFRTANVENVQQYIDLCNDVTPRSFPFSPAVNVHEYISKKESMNETMMLGFRLIDEGIYEEDFQKRYGIDIYSVYDKKIDKLIAQGLIEHYGNESRGLRLTRRGIELGNQVFREFV